MPNFRSAALVVALAVCVRLEAQNEVRQYRETHGSRVSFIEYSVSRIAQEVVVRSSGGGVANEIHWVPGTGTVSWRERDAGLDNDLYAERTGDIIRMKGRLRGRQTEREVRVDAAPWYQIFGPIMSDLLPLGVTAKEFWTFNPENFTLHKMLVRRVGAEVLSFRGSRIKAEKIHFSPAGLLAAFWGADFWYRKLDGVWLYSRLPESRGVTISELEEPGAPG
jgi:hypothetical protein